MSGNKTTVNTKSSLLHAMATPSLLGAMVLILGIAMGIAESPAEADISPPPVAAEQYKERTSLDIRDDFLESAKDDYCEDSKAKLCGTSRTLHKNEIRLLRSVFGDILPLDEVRIGYADIDDSADSGFRSGGFALGSRLMFDNYPARYSSDYSKKRPGFFIHEFVHLLQDAGLLSYNENGPAQNSLAMYHYTVAGKKSLSEFTSEQQAQIVEDYVSMVLNGYPSDDCRDCIYSDETYNSARIRTIRNLVEKAFPKAREFRMAQGACNFVAQAEIESRRKTCEGDWYELDGRTQNDFASNVSQEPIAPSEPITPSDIPIPSEPVIIASIPTPQESRGIDVTSNAPPPSAPPGP